MEKIIEKIDHGIVSLLIFPFNRVEPVELGRGCFCYDRITAILVRLKYSQDAVEAIICNYLSDPKNEQWKREFDELQSYRRECKTEAAALVKIYEEQQKKV